MVSPLLLRTLYAGSKLEEKYIFAVCTCGGYEIVNAVPALCRLHRFVKKRGARLAAEYTVRLPMNNLNYEHIPVPIETDTTTIIGSAEMQIEDICKRILRRRRGKYHVLRRLFTVMMTPLYWMMAKTCMKSLRELTGKPKDFAMGFRELIPLTGKSITVDDNCTGCATCIKVCPVDNIKLVHKKPVWQHRCEMCFACDEWCPSLAIHHWGRPDEIKYHHPDINLKDMMRR